MMTNITKAEQMIKTLAAVINSNPIEKKAISKAQAQAINKLLIKADKVTGYLGFEIINTYLDTFANCTLHIMYTVNGDDDSWIFTIGKKGAVKGYNKLQNDLFNI